MAAVREPHPTFEGMLMAGAINDSEITDALHSKCPFRICVAAESAALSAAEAIEAFARYFDGDRYPTKAAMLKQVAARARRAALLSSRAADLLHPVQEAGDE